MGVRTRGSDRHSTLGSARHSGRAGRPDRAARTGAAVVALILAASLTGAATPALGAPPTDDVRRCACGAGFLGFSDALNKRTFAGTAVGGLSDLSYDRKRHRYYALVDRQGDTPARFYTLRMPSRDRLHDPLISDVTYLRDASGRRLTGKDVDSEGMAVTPGRGLFISSETEPSIRRFSRGGRLLRELPVPEKFLVEHGQAQRNRTFEALAVSPNQRNLFAAVEAPLRVDGRTEAGEGRIRLLRYEARGTGGFRPTAEYFYRTEPGQYVVETIALSADDLLVLERSYAAGQGNTIRVFHVSLAGAPDVSAARSLAAPGLTPARKSLVVDVLNCPEAGAETPGTQPNPLLDNYEGMTLGPHLSGGRRALLLISDDNFNEAQVTRVVSLAVDLDRQTRTPVRSFT